ncbi:MAG: hypothetical protein ACYCV5_10515, partial [Acidimicrobiales bacterium]
MPVRPAGDAVAAAGARARREPIAPVGPSSGGTWVALRMVVGLRRITARASEPHPVGSGGDRRAGLARQRQRELGVETRQNP